ncbi:hypothetical protein F5Y08DRAFT_350852 [Xylaria arbuscula]|nr:hypothetical protein F5Y08DRAFT_350852 [Xylaria arbuscula]
MHHIPREGQRGEEQETWRILPYSGTSTSCAATRIYDPSKEQEGTSQGMSQAGQSKPHGTGSNIVSQDSIVPEEFVFIRSNAPSRSFSTGSGHTLALADHTSPNSDIGNDLSHDPKTLATPSTAHDSQSKASHQSTRELFFDRKGVVYMVIRRQAISMRTPGHQLNASEILKATNLQPAMRKSWLGKLKSHGVGAKGMKRGDCWVPFQDGVFLCQAIGLKDDLKPLLSHPGLSLPLREDNYLLRRKRRRQPGKELDNGYASLLHGGHTIVYQPIKEIVNATHLLKLGDIPRRRLANFFAANSGIAKEIVNRGSLMVLGTYISFQDAISLCHYFELDVSPVQRLLQGQSESTSVPDVSPNGQPSNSSSKTDPVAAPQDSQTRQPPDLSRSIYTEPSYQHGSYLAPTNNSYLQLLN